MSRGHLTDITIPNIEPGQPAWAVATLFPPQGEWTEEDYFRLETGHLVELVNGCLEVLPMPTWLHQRIVAWLFRQFSEWSFRNGRCEVLFAPLPMRLAPGTIREPDLMVLERTVESPSISKYPTTALVLIEVISDGAEARQRDLISKRDDYARAGIPEYWIVDPLEKTVSVLQLDGAKYREHGKYHSGEIAASAVLDGMVIDCSTIWALENGLPS